MMIKQREGANLSKRSRHVVATATALTFLCQNFAWAACADGSTFPDNGFVRGQPPAVNWSPNVFSGATASFFIPDNSVFENNDPTQPLTGGGHNWVFDQGSTLCKATDTGPAGGAPTAWVTPQLTPGNCIFLPVINGSSGNPPTPHIVNFTDIPFQGDVVTPTCDPTQYVGGHPFVGPALPTNTYFNHLGCSISHGAATTPQTATTYLFATGVHGGMFVIPLTNVAGAVAGGPAGKTPGGPDWFGSIPLGQKLTSAAVSPDGQFAMATSSNKLQTVFACNNPLGDPTRTNPLTGAQSFPITGPIDPNFSTAVAETVPCMQVGNNALPSDVTTIFGPDANPYFGGSTGVNSFINPGNVTAWPQCIFNGFSFPSPAPTTLMGKLAAVFNARSANHCGNAVSGNGFLVNTDYLVLLRHGSYLYVGTTAGQVVQFKVTVEPGGISIFPLRFYVGGLDLITGIGIADDLKSLVVYNALQGADVRWESIKMPLCEDILP
jgi:hypothetical protein